MVKIVKFPYNNGVKFQNALKSHYCLRLSEHLFKNRYRELTNIQVHYEANKIKRKTNLDLVYKMFYSC